MAVVPAVGGVLSARVLVRALIGRGVPAVLSSVEQVTADAVDATATQIVLVDADEDGKLVEQTCLKIREAHPDVKLVLLLSPRSTEGAQLLARRLAERVVSRAAGLESLLTSIHAAARGSSGGRSGALVPRQREDVHQAIASLTPREREVLRLVATGAANSHVAHHLQISPHTVRTHVQNVLAKLGAENRLAAAAMARRAGILPTGLDTTDAYAGAPR